MRRDSLERRPQRAEVTRYEHAGVVTFVDPKSRTGPESAAEHAQTRWDEPPAHSPSIGGVAAFEAETSSNSGSGLG